MDKRTEGRVIRNPNNRWVWYEVAKEIMVANVQQLFDVAKRLGISGVNDAINDGYHEYKESRR